MSFKDLSTKISAATKVAADEKPKPAPKNGAPGKAPAREAPAPDSPKNS